MTEMRWLQVGDDKKLQYRVRNFNGTMFDVDWSEWMDVPVVGE